MSTPPPTSSRRATPAGLRRFLRNPLGVAAASVLLLMVLASALAPLLAPFDPNATDLVNALTGPTATHPLGTDSAGRDVLSRLLYGAQITFLCAGIATLVAIIVGVPAGLLAGYRPGPVDGTASWVSNMLMSVPAIIVLLAARAAFGPSIWITVVIFGVVFSPGFFRLTRTAVVTVRNELYIDAARVSGLSDLRIVSRHVLSVVRAPILIQAALIAGITIDVQAGLEFLGLGDQSTPSWGMMLNEGFRNVYLSPINLLWPAIAIALTTAALAILGNALRDALEDGDAPGASGSRGGRRTHPAATLETAHANQVSASPSGHLLTVDGLCIEYPQRAGVAKRVVDGVSFHVDRGEVLGIVGESGSGKTQTAFSILGLLPPEAEVAAGRIVFDGIPLVDPLRSKISQREIAPLRGTRIAYIPQEPMSNLDPNFTIGSQLTRPLRLRGTVSKSAAKKKALELLASVGIPDPQRTFSSYPHEISGGMAQRVLIAGAISGEPELLIADEPTTALDVTVQAEILDLLRELQKDLGMAVIMVTHNLGVVADLCDRVVVMRSARLVEEGAVRKILSSPEEDYTRMLLAATLEGKTPRSYLLGGKQGREES